jgi:hypothetical protein
MLVLSEPIESLIQGSGYRVNLKTLRSILRSPVPRRERRERSGKGIKKYTGKIDFRVFSM